MTKHENLSLLLEAALEAVDPYQAVKQSIQLHLPAIQQARKVYVVGCGKAVVPMALAVEDVLGESITRGVVLTKYGHLAKGMNQYINVLEAAHPVPDRAGIEATTSVLDVLREAQEEDIVLALISGGGSALWVQPPASVSLEDKMQVSSLLLQSGAAINEMNTVRKHLSCIKGGHAAVEAYPARVFAYLISDVVGDALDVIASGPFAPDSTSFSDAIAIVDRYALAGKMPDSVMAHLKDGVRGILPDTPRDGDVVFERVHHEICSANRLAVEAVRIRAEALGYQVVVRDEPLVGEAVEAAHDFTQHLLSLRGSRPLCFIAGGETTVTLGDTPGKGGRNQEFALAAAAGIDGYAVHVASLATDGNDGPTDAAGAHVDGKTWQGLLALGYDPEKELHQHNAYPLLQACGALLMTGPTNTNVADIQIGLLD